MDVLRKELNEVYTRQHLEKEMLDYGCLDEAIGIAGAMVSVCNSCAVITDVARDKSFFFMGTFGKMLGLSSEYAPYHEISSSDEDFIYDKMHPEDLVDKRMLEYEFFKFVEKKSVKQRLGYKAVCRMRMENADGGYVYVENSTQLLRLSPGGKIWLVLCCYDLSAMQTEQVGINGRIVNNGTGEIIQLSFSENRGNVLSLREKEILNHIKAGKLSKEIAGMLGISVNTVNRHRQNILYKLSVNNSLEAVKAATAMNLI